MAHMMGEEGRGANSPEKEDDPGEDHSRVEKMEVLRELREIFELLRRCLRNDRDE